MLVEKIYALLAAHLAEGRPVTLKTELRGESGLVKSGLSHSIECSPCPQVAVEEKEGRILITEPVLPPQRLIILGGGHVGLALSEFAAKCGFAVTVVDDRPAFAAPERFPWAEKVVCGEFVESLDCLGVGPRDFVAILTRGHSHDGDCLRALLDRPATAYLGMIGSRKRVGAMREELAKEGYSQTRLDALRAPIGLPIGAATPAEIAVSILAELISYRRLPSHGGDTAVTDLDTAVVGYLAGNSGPMAVATIISREGHSPRGPGAKMAVRPDGSTYGTVGGGAGEAAVILAARECAGSGRYQILSINMDGSVTQREGMACGGSIRVLIEDAVL